MGGIQVETPMPQPTVDASRNDREVVALLSKVRSHLERARRRISQEIREYPTPITACDAQFNHLLEEQAGVSEELRRVREAVERGCQDTSTIGLLAEFARASRYLDEELRGQITASLAA